MIDGSEKRNRQLAFELQNSHVCEKRSKKKVAPPLPAHFAGVEHQLEDMQVAVIRAGPPEQDKRRRQEMRFIHNFGTLAPRGLNQDFSFT